MSNDTNNVPSLTTNKLVDGLLELNTDLGKQAVERIKLLSEILHPFSSHYDKLAGLAKEMGKTLDEVIGDVEEINKSSLEKTLENYTDPGERLFWVECDMAANFELMCVKIIHQVLRDREVSP